jgi:hypothetical protein
MSFKALFPKKKTARIKHQIVGFDVETTQKKFNFKRKNGKEYDAKTNDFYLGGLYEDDKYEGFLDQNEMIKHLLSSKYNNKLIVATNLGFDFNTLFYDTEYWDKFKIIQVNGRMIACIYQPYKELKITFLDTFNYIPFSVKIMGEILGIPKLKSPLCLGRFPNNETEKEELIIYNKRDCEISCKFLEFIQKGFYELLGGELKLTIASTSMNLFQRKYLRFPIKHECNFLEEEEKSFKDFLFKGYYGGRTETFTRGKIVNMNCYDINSLYPSVMINEYPNPNSIIKIKDPDKEFFKYLGISEVKVYCPPMKYPYLPFRTDKLIFPTGTFSGVYTHLELERAISLGYKILEVKKQYIYKKGFYPFRSYIKDLYNNRLKYKKIDSPFELIFKLCMNSFYGKFAQKRTQDLNFIDINNFNKDEHIAFSLNNLEENIFLNPNGKGFTVNTNECESSFVIPIFAIYTTAYARDILYNYLSKYNGLYCDTDSISTAEVMPTSLKLGAMKLEYKILSGVLVKPKMYYYDTPDKQIIKLKGIPTRTREVFFKLLNKECVSYAKFSKVKESLRSNIKPNSIINVSKFVGLEDNKRVWLNVFDPTVREESEPIFIAE